MQEKRRTVAKRCSTDMVKETLGGRRIGVNVIMRPAAWLRLGRDDKDTNKPAPGSRGRGQRRGVEDVEHHLRDLREVTLVVLMIRTTVEM